MERSQSETEGALHRNGSTRYTICGFVQGGFDEPAPAIRDRGYTISINI